MSIRLGLALCCAPLWVACSSADNESIVDNTSEPAPPVQVEEAPLLDTDRGDAAELDCPGFEALFALLPNRLAGETTGEQYFSCDAVAPKASSHFVSEDQNTVWTFSVLSRSLDTVPATHLWDLPGGDAEQKNVLKHGVKAAIAGEVLLFDLCMNNLQQAALPDWHKTSLGNSERHEVCVGSDAQMVEEGRWVARAKSAELLYAVEVQGDKAAQFGNARAATSYLVDLFRQFR